MYATENMCSSSFSSPIISRNYMQCVHEFTQTDYTHTHTPSNKKLM